MSQPMKISIPSPCHENWDGMTPNKKGRFCNSCQKTVLDFTNSSDREIASVLKNSKNACGRFRTAQLDRELVIPKEKSSLWVAASAAVISFVTIGNNDVSAQTPTNTEQHISETDEIIGDTIALAPINRIVKGIVSENGNPIHNATVINKSNNKTAITDPDGIFRIEANIGDTLSVSYIGLTTKEVIVNSHDNTNIVMEMESIGLIIYRKKTFFGRIFQFIGNLFR